MVTDELLRSLSVNVVQSLNSTEDSDEYWVLSLPLAFTILLKS